MNSMTTLFEAARAYRQVTDDLREANDAYLASGKGGGSPEYAAVRVAGTAQAHAIHALEHAAAEWAREDKRRTACTVCPACGDTLICPSCP